MTEADFKSFGGYRRYLMAFVPGIGPAKVAESIASTPERVICDCKRLGVPLSEAQVGRRLERVEAKAGKAVVTDEIVRLRDEEGMGWVRIGERVGCCASTAKERYLRRKNG